MESKFSVKVSERLDLYGSVLLHGRPGTGLSSTGIHQLLRYEGLPYTPFILDCSSPIPDFEEYVPSAVLLFDHISNEKIFKESFSIDFLKRLDELSHLKRNGEKCIKVIVILSDLQWIFLSRLSYCKRIFSKEQIISTSEDKYCIKEKEEIAARIGDQFNLQLTEDAISHILKNSHLGICRFTYYFAKQLSQVSSEKDIDRIAFECYEQELQRYFHDFSVESVVLSAVFLFSGLSNLSRIYDALKGHSRNAYTQLEINECIHYFIEKDYIEKSMKDVYKFIDVNIEQCVFSLMNACVLNVLIIPFAPIRYLKLCAKNMQAFDEIQQRIKRELDTQSPAAFDEISNLKICFEIYKRQIPSRHKGLTFEEVVSIAKDEDGNLLLYHAIRNGNEDLMAYLLDSLGRDAIDCIRLFEKGVRFGRIGICDYILNRYEISFSDLQEFRDSEDKSLLTISVESSDIEMVKYILSKVRCIKSDSVEAAAKLGNINVLNLFYSQKSSILTEHLDNKGHNVFHLASKTMDTAVFNWTLRQRDCPYNSQDLKGKCALYYILRKGYKSHLRCIEANRVLDRFKINLATTSNESILHAAIRSHNMEILTLLLKLFTIPSSMLSFRNSFGYTPLALAISLSDVTFLEFLLSRLYRDTNSKDVECRSESILQFNMNRPFNIRYEEDQEIDVFLSHLPYYGCMFAVISNFVRRVSKAFLVGNKIFRLRKWGLSMQRFKKEKKYITAEQEAMKLTDVLLNHFGTSCFRFLF